MRVYGGSAEYGQVGLAKEEGQPIAGPALQKRATCCSGPKGSQNPINISADARKDRDNAEFA